MARGITLFHHLSIVPAWLCPFDGRRTTSSLIVRHATVDLYERLPMPAPSIRQHRRWAVTVCFAAFHLLPELNSRLRFGLPNASPHTQACAGLNWF